jgi:uncharacterized protein YdhG (YjbR/CyaY superfamily)
MSDLEEYLKGFEGIALERVLQIRKFCSRLIPGSEEEIRYGIPTLRLNGKNVIHFAAYKNHSGFYPGAACMKAFSEELRSFKTGPGSVQFPHKDPIPEELIQRMVEFRLKEESSKS